MLEIEGEAEINPCQTSQSQPSIGIWGHAPCDFIQTPTEGGKLRMYPVRSFCAHEIRELMIDQGTGER